jgi:menaquinone-dependent protoporphyrinogen oxidase
MEGYTRRGFILTGARISGIGIAAMTIGAALFRLQTARAEEIRFPESNCRGESMRAPRILVTYASMYGSTGGIAEALGQALCRNGAQVDVRYLKHASGVDRYDAVVVGSAVRSSQWLPEAIEFVEGHRKTLRDMPVAYFLSCLTLARSNAETRRKAAEFLVPLRKAVPEVNPVGIGRFAGVLDYGKMSFPMQIIMKRKMKASGIGEGDYRDWAAIRAWAAEIHPKLILA